MVSTRGIKLKFFVGERVLCYEPDPTKAKVLYDSKVLDIVIKKYQNGKKVVEYLIHFQGWNSSWDRCVGEDFVLKDTAENRQLQRDLAERSQLQLGAYLYRKERKKRNIKSSDNYITTLEGSSGGLANADNIEMSSSSDEHSSMEEEQIDIELTPELHEIIQMDYDLVKERNKILRLPAEPNIVTILEMYYKHYATNQICGLNEKSNPRKSYSDHKNNIKPKPEDVQRNLQLCREVMDGLRIYFDFTLNDLLLYAVEKGQIQTSMAIAQLVPNENAFSNSRIKLEPKPYAPEYSTNIHISNQNLNQNGHNNISSAVNPRKRSLRSSTSKSLSESSTSSSNNGHPLGEEACPVQIVKPSSSSSSSTSDTSNPMTKVLGWKLLPDYAYSQQPPPPSLVYGATHLVRLFVKLPELLAASNIPDIKLKVLLRHFDLIIDYLTEHKEWFGEMFYIDAL